jgi:hypothetical protein
MRCLRAGLRPEIVEHPGLEEAERIFWHLESQEHAQQISESAPRELAEEVDFRATTTAM